MIVNLDAPDLGQTRDKALHIFDDRCAIRKSLEQTGAELMQQLAEVAKVVKGTEPKSNK